MVLTILSIFVLPCLGLDLSDFRLETTEVHLTMANPQGTVRVMIPREQDARQEDQSIEMFTLVLTDAVGLAPPNMFFREALVNIQDTGRSSFFPSSFQVVTSKV